MELKYSIDKNIQIVIALLKAHNIRKIIVSPGATNMPFVTSIQHDSFFEIYSCVDERSAAYMACGMADQSGEPVALSCTGATSSRNYMPGLTEAYYRKLPIVAITSSQPNENIGHLSAQCTDRTQLPADIALVSVQVPPVLTDYDVWDREIKVNRALLELTHRGGGPVHINLISNNYRNFSVKELPSYRKISRITPNDTFPTLPNGKILIFIGSHKRFTQEEEKVIDAFCAKYNSAVLCDHTSGYHGAYRMQYALVASQKQYRSESMNPDLLIHLGDISGDYYTLSINPKNVWRVSEDGEIRDKFKKLTCIFEMNEKDFFSSYSTDSINDKQTALLENLKAEDLNIRKKLPEFPFSNIWVASALSHRIPKNSVVHFAILNSLRSWNFFNFNEEVHTYCNVGGFGIDGILSSAIGASIISPEKLVFTIIGDLAFFYDMNALGNRYISNNLRILLINNGKGTEFRNYDHSSLILGNEADKFVAAAGHFGNQSPDLVKHYASDLGFTYLKADNKEEFMKQIDIFTDTDNIKAPILFEVFTNSTDESQALKDIRNVISTPKMAIKNKARELKQVITNIFNT